MNIDRCLLRAHQFQKDKKCGYFTRTLIVYFAFESSNSKEGFLSEFTQITCAAA